MAVYYYPFPTKALILDFCTYCLRQNNSEVAELYRVPLFSGCSLLSCCSQMKDIYLRCMKKWMLCAVSSYLILYSPLSRQTAIPVFRSPQSCFWSSGLKIAVTVF